MWRDATVCRSAPIVLVLTIKGRLTVGSGMVSSIGLSAIEAGTYHLLLDYGTNRKPARRSALVASPGVQAVFWVRIYRDTHSAVVIIADVPANPGPSPDIVDVEIATQLARDYELGDLNVRWFICYPGKYSAGRPSSVTKYHEAGFSGTKITRIYCRGAREIPRSEISGAIGRSLDLMPRHEEVLECVFAVGGRLEYPGRPTRYIILPATARSIPPPIRPFKCAYREDFERFIWANTGVGGRLC